ncbi:Electron transfer flavoprotein subunit beta [compost metagenome]
MGADDAVHIHNDLIQTDEYGISRILASFLQQHEFDVIFGGFFSVDHGSGQVAIRLARLLGIPHISAITALEANQDHLLVTRDAEGDTEAIEVNMPVLLTAQQGLNEPRYPSLPGIMKAKKKPFRDLTLSDLRISAADISPKTQRTALSLPQQRTAGIILQGTLSEQTSQLVKLLSLK